MGTRIEMKGLTLIYLPPQEEENRMLVEGRKRRIRRKKRKQDLSAFHERLSDDVTESQEECQPISSPIWIQNWFLTVIFLISSGRERWTPAVLPVSSFGWEVLWEWGYKRRSAEGARRRPDVVIAEEETQPTQETKLLCALQELETLKLERLPSAQVNYFSPAKLFRIWKPQGWGFVRIQTQEDNDKDKLRILVRKKLKQWNVESKADGKEGKWEKTDKETGNF